MKYVRFASVSLLLLLMFSSCKKGNTRGDGEPEGDGSLEGTWELHQSASGMTPLTTYPKGNGMLLEFNGDSYKIYMNNAVVQRGSYTIASQSYTDVMSCEIKTPTLGKLNTIIYDNNPYGMYFELSGNKLKTTSGCFPADGGWSVYKKVKSVTVTE